MPCSTVSVVRSSPHWALLHRVLCTLIPLLSHPCACPQPRPNALPCLTQSSEELADMLGKLYPEKQLYRIDHYLVRGG